MILKNTFFVLVLTFVFFSCKPKVTPLYPYNVTLSYDELNYDGSGFVVNEKTDTVMVENDGEAYQKGLFSAAARDKTMKKLYGTRSKVYWFSVTDSLGRSVGETLGRIRLDSLNKGLTVIDAEVKGKFKL